MKEKLNVWSKKWWFWVIIVVILLGIIGMGAEDETQTNEDNPSNNSNAITYTIVGEELGDFGKEVVLNKNTDMPVTKYLYKLPSGSYIVSTSYDKMAAFFIVKDNVVNTGSAEYPEELDYVSEQYSLTAGSNDFNGIAKKSVDIELKNDESILINGTATYIFTKK